MSSESMLFESTDGTQLQTGSSFFYNSTLNSSITFPMSKTTDSSVSGSQLQFETTPSSPASKRRRIGSGPSNLTAESSLSFNDEGPGDSIQTEVSPSLSAGDIVSLQSELDHEEDNLDLETHANRLAMQRAMQAANLKKDNYTRHVLKYMSWTDVEGKHRALENPTRRFKLTAEPITVAKVALFLEYETKRAKANSGTGTVGAESVSQTISALENHRVNHQHEKVYRDCLESQKPLRSDRRVTTFEKFAHRNEHLWASNGEKMKTQGPVSASYTPAQLKQLSVSALQPARKTRISTAKSLRDRAIILLCSTMAFRGDSVRGLEISDLGVEDLPMPAIAPGVTVKTLIAFCDNGKHNKEGRIEKHAAFRHLHPEMCAIGALAFYFFSEYHILGKSPPNFAPDFDDPDASELGDNRASLEGRKALGKWKEGRGAFENAYDDQVPIDAMLGVAMFDAQRPDSYTCSRNCLQPPPELLEALFPWVEDKMKVFENRRKDFGKRAEDYSLDQFLNLLVYLRSVLLQDAALIFAEFPACHVFTFAPFNSSVFQDWAQNSRAIVDSAEAEAREAFKNIPTNLISSLRGILVTERIESERRHQSLHQELLSAVSLNVLPATKNKSRKRKRKISTTEPLAANINTSNTHSSVYPPLPSIQVPVQPPVCESETLPSTVLKSTNTISPPSSDSLGLISSTVGSITTTIPSTILNPGITAPTAAPPMYSEEQASVDMLRQRYSEVKYTKHELWEWDRERKEHLPSYQYQKPSTLCAYWEELTVGLNGYISVQELNNRWEAQWRRNISGLKTEKCRYDRVEELIQKLRSRDNWTMDLVWRFLDARFPIPTKDVPHLRTARSFITYIQKKDGSGMNEVLTAANSYC
ncbi:hypothetical protein BDP27DRAFT_1367866 [Rhodocollybia butyracea]|uniref:Ndc10 domain-containing protein n=1 Tax=Rhodocollybia butyracea TaxID=206335 RepID=A0A9P5U269_9AGAR|nr:hypothetical protein BDP27DRAFT_1367866 [Rhodocollybia butyracea]